MNHALFALHALLPTGWAKDVSIRWDEAGTLTHVTPDTTPEPGVQRPAGVIVPGMPNLHSHAFQRAFAGLSEYRGAQGQAVRLADEHLLRAADRRVRRRRSRAGVPRFSQIKLSAGGA